MRVCNEPGCPILTDGKPKCERHRLEGQRRSSAKRRKTPQQQMYAGVGEQGRAWRAARAEFIRLHPLCQDTEGCLRPVDHVHHIDNDPLGPRGLDPTNFQGLCVSHHSRITAKEKPSGWNAR